MEGSAPREPLRGAAATERGFSAPSWDPFVAGTTALLKLGEVRLIKCGIDVHGQGIQCIQTTKMERLGRGQLRTF